jgi:hypothetical protein
MSLGLLDICGLQPGALPMPVSFATDIRPLFRDSPDVDSMQGYGLDLASYEEVRARGIRNLRRGNAGGW